MPVVTKLNEIASLAMQLCEEWEADGNRDASTIPSPWPFSDDKSGGMSIDEWAFQVRGLAEAYEPTQCFLCGATGVERTLSRLGDHAGQVTDRADQIVELCALCSGEGSKENQ